MLTESLVAEKLLLPLIKRFVSESSSKEDSVSSRCSKDPEERRAGNRSSIFKGKEGVAPVFSVFPAEAIPSKAVISTAQITCQQQHHEDLEAEGHRLEREAVSPQKQGLDQGTPG